MPQQKQNIPALRFPEFDGVWKLLRFGDVSESIKSGRSSYGETGKYPVYGSTGKIGYSDTYEFDGFSILIARVGANAGQINRACGFYGVTDNTLAIILKDGTDHSFIISLLKKANLNRFIYGSGQPLITGTMLKNIKAYVPSLEEQKKIAAFLGAVDEKISQLQKKKELLEDYKKGCMQKLFSQAIRFTDDNGNPFPDWEEKPLGKLVMLRAGSSKSSHVCSEGRRYVIDMGAVSSSGKLIPSKKTDYNDDLLKSGQLVMPKDDIGGGNIIGRVGLINRDDLYVLGDHVYLLDDIKCNSYFLSYRINSFEINKSFRRKANGTAQLGLARDSVLKQPIQLPKSEREQKNIADFLSAIDDKIALVSKELEKAKTFKKGLLQQMFV